MTDENKSREMDLSIAERERKISPSIATLSLTMSIMASGQSARQNAQPVPPSEKDKEAGRNSTNIFNTAEFLARQLRP